MGEEVAPRAPQARGCLPPAPCRCRTSPPGPRLMRAIITRPGMGRAWLEDIPEPAITQPDQVLVKILQVGVCGTDRHVMEHPVRSVGALPDGDDFLVIGHEAVGRVVQVGDAVSSLRAGDLVVPTVRRGCGACPACD